ncbi:hypothetical protein G9A89_000530, partial [Geosiphon pyriformis]
MSPLCRVQQNMPTRKSNHHYCRLELPLVAFPALNCPNRSTVGCNVECKETWTIMRNEVTVQTVEVWSVKWVRGVIASGVCYQRIMTNTIIEPVTLEYPRVKITTVLDMRVFIYGMFE